MMLVKRVFEIRRIKVSAKKNVLFLANILALGGLEKVVVTISNELSRSENVTLYSLKGDTFGYEYANDLTVINGEDLIWNAVRHPSLSLRAIVGRKLVQKKELNFRRIVKDIDFTKFDNVVLSEADILYAALIRKKNPSIKIIGWIHNTFESYRDTYMKGSYNQFLEVLKSVDLLVVLTDNDRNSYSKIHPNVIKINNPITIPPMINKPEKTFFENMVSFVGRLEYKQKGLDYLIEISSRLPEGWKISVAGDGPDKNKFEDEIEARNLEKKFIVKGALKGDQLLEHYLSSSIFVLTSRWEGFGLVITEAMSLGLPVIAFNSYGPKEILGENNEYGVVVENGNIEKFSDALNTMISDRSLREYYSHQSAKRVLDYKLESIIPQWKSILT